MRTSLIGLLLLVLSNLPAHAVLQGKTTRDPDGLRRSVVWIDNSEGELCSGALVRPDLVLTAAHCMLDHAVYRVVAFDHAFRRRSFRVIAMAVHPTFVPGVTPHEQTGIDLALVKLDRPLPNDFMPFDLRLAEPFTDSEAVTIAGYGVLSEREESSAHVLRHTELVSLGPIELMNRVLIVADPVRQAQTAGAGACRGDSGGPILAASPEGDRLIGIVSWSSAPFSGAQDTACGGRTAVTPLAENMDWIGRGIDLLNNLGPARR